ncbi:unnamed protein product [Pleuronectes platessa]|uniref:Uncharacterized protein n=1 Tax=Pleuronectes platessa TaxID=8262 RepID=A0A9N7YUI9_PLEPL|nr:unnamed protein product [Pleuronectes platessa]
MEKIKRNSQRVIDSMQSILNSVERRGKVAVLIKKETAGEVNETELQREQSQSPGCEGPGTAQTCPGTARSGSEEPEPKRLQPIAQDVSLFHEEPADMYVCRFREVHPELEAVQKLANIMGSKVNKLMAKGGKVVSRTRTF